MKRTNVVFTPKTLFPKLALALIAAWTLGATAMAQTPTTPSGGSGSGGGEDGSQGVYSSRGGSPWATYYRYLEENPEIYAEADRTFPNGQTNYGQHGETKKEVPGPKIPGKIWPIVTQPHIPEGPEKMMNWAKTMDRITGYSQEPIGQVNLSPAFAALSMGVAGQMLADELQSPQATMPRAREEQNQQIQLSADNTAAMERQQAGCAIDFVASYLYNFTVEEGNKWNQVRNRLFLPMALLLLLPGAVLAQVKSIASQGFTVLGEINPWDGIMRSIVAIFLIPGTYLVVNYGIDVANSITKTVSEEYRKIFGTNMYEDAMCAHIRAFPFREPIENKNYVPNAEAKMGRLSPNDTPFAELEGKMINIKLTDPCAKLNIVPADRANEQVKYSVNAQRNAYNTANAALAMAWNILCAFQMAYLYYLWFVGPVVAALWVYPMKQLRDAFPSWCEGVITICFWSLFWSTVVLLMACFRGVDETGTVIMTALNFLATACVKFAFDFAGLVKDAGREAGRMAEKMASAAASGGKGANAQGGHTPQSAPAGTHGHNVNGGGPGSHGVNGAPGGMTAGEDSVLAGGPGGLGFEGEALEGAAGASGVPGALSPHAAGINGAVSMADFPHPPLAGHHGNALGVVGTALGGAALFTGLAAMAQPHFMHQQGPGGVLPGGPSDPNGGTGVAGAGPHANADDGKGIPIASVGMEVGDDITHEGDIYEHNWGESAINAPISSVTLGGDGPPLASLPTGPALSLTPDVANALGLPPSSLTDNSIALGLNGLPGTGDTGIAGAAGGNGAVGANLAPNLVANADPIGQVGVHGAAGPQHGAGHGHDPLNILGGHQSHHAGDHVAHHGGVHHNGPHHNNQAGDHHENTLNAMFKDGIALNAAGGHHSAPPSFHTPAVNVDLNNTNIASINGVGAGGNGIAGGPQISATAANFNSTDMTLTGGANQQYIDYSIAGATANQSTLPGSPSSSSYPQYVDNSVAAAGGGNYYDPSAASFSALAQSVAGDGVTYVDDGTVGYADPGISTTAADGNYTTASYTDYGTTYGGSDYSTTAYGTDYTTAYGNDYSSAYGADYTTVDDGTFIDSSSTAYAAPALSTTVSANVNSTTNNTDSYNNALAAGGFVAPAPDGQQTFAGQQQNIAVNNTMDVYGSGNTPVPSSNIAMNNVDVSQVSALNAPQPQSANPNPIPANADIQLNQQPANTHHHIPGTADVVMNASVNHAGNNTVLPGGPADTVINAAAGAAIGSAFGNPAQNNAQQHLRNQLAYPDPASGKQGPLQQPKNMKVAPPGGKQVPIVGIGGTPGQAKQSALGAALGKAGTSSPQGAKPGGPQQLSRPSAPVVKPVSSKGSLQDSVQAANTRNRYVQAGKLSDEELAELERKARESGDWFPTV